MSIFLHLVLFFLSGITGTGHHGDVVSAAHTAAAHGPAYLAPLDTIEAHP